MNYKKNIAAWLLGIYAMIFVMVIVGGVTRLTRSGLSIVEWKPITGVLPPLSQDAWRIQFEKYKQFPEFKRVNSKMNLEEFKFIFFWEYIHRLLGRLIGLVFFIPFVYFWVRGRLSEDRLLPKTALAFLLGGAQGFMGWYMVKSGLVSRPSVSHYRLSAHLLLAFVIMMYVFYISLDLLRKKEMSATPPPETPAGIRTFAWGLTGLIFFQIFYGALTAGLKAGYMYNTFPLMAGALVPPGLLGGSGSPFFSLLENPMTVQFIHRCLGWLLFIIVLGFRFFLMERARGSVRLALNLLAAGIVLQFLLGVFTLLYAVPVTLGVIHQVGAMVLLTFSIYLNHTLKISD